MNSADTPTRERGWHVNRDGYATLHAEPDGRIDTLRALSDAQWRRVCAVHESGHAVLMLRLGIPVLSMDIHGPDNPNRFGKDFAASITTGDIAAVSFLGWAASMAAGERAHDRWLRKAGLWTPERAWAAEWHARSDREDIAETVRDQLGRVLTHGATNEITDYAVICRHTDDALSLRWPVVLTLADALETSSHLDGDQVRAIVGTTRQEDVA